MPSFIRLWFLKKELRFWKLQLESLANEIEYTDQNSEHQVSRLMDRHSEYQKVADVLEDLIGCNV